MSTVVLAVVADMAAPLLGFAIFFYPVVYTFRLTRRSSWNVVIDGAARGLPPVIGWITVTGHIGIGPLVLFLIIVLWTPPTFWALSLLHTNAYARVGIPMLPVAGGKVATGKQIYRVVQCRVR